MPWRPEPVFLIPELCYQTGLSPDMLGDFNTMKALANITKKEPAERLRACQQLLHEIQSNPSTREEAIKWGLNFNTNPLALAAHRLELPEIQLGATSFRPDE